MNEHGDGQDSVEERLVGAAFDELAGRTTPPDRSAEILARVAGAAQEAPSDAGGGGGARWLAAALLLLGVGVTVYAAMQPGSSGEPNQGGERADPVAQLADVQPPLVGVAGPRDPELPKGADPADLAAMRSAEAMLAAEAKLQQLIADGRIAGVDQVLPFDDLEDWKYVEGLQGAPDDVRALDGKQVLMLGFMLPLDEVEDMQEFLLVSSLWSCCYGTPPDIHGIVRCRMSEGRRVDYQFEPVKVVGRFSVQETREDGYCVDIYQLDVEVLEVVQ